jgi:hypothetical protein
MGPSLGSHNSMFPNRQLLVGHEMSTPREYATADSIMRSGIRFYDRS